jgi:hypothetical protein
MGGKLKRIVSQGVGFKQGGRGTLVWEPWRVVEGEEVGAGKERK